MAAGFFGVLQHISLLADDTSVAIKATAGVLGDDVAVASEKASGFHASREIPVLWAIGKGSMINKIIILPLMFLLSAFLPEVIIPILLMGGIYLAFEGFEKIWEMIFPHDNSKNHEDIQNPDKDIMEIEKEKIKSAVITDFVLSVEIVLIALSTVAEKVLMEQIIIVSLVAIIATVGVYGFVALIVKMDDFGFWIMGKANTVEDIIITESNFKPEYNSITKIEQINHFNPTIFVIGAWFISAMGFIIKSLGYIGTIAMILVAGGIFSHNIYIIHHFVEELPIYSFLSELGVGIIVGIISFTVYESIIHIKHKLRPVQL